MRSARVLVLGMLVCTLAFAVSACCATAGPGSGGGDSTAGGGTSSGSGGATGGTGGQSGGAVADADEIPAGRAIREGGGGPESYTFREEWRRALAEARKWRAKAALIHASGNFVNDDGIPSEWQCTFAEALPTDELFVVTIDPWGNVTSTKAIDTSKVLDLVQPGEDAIPLGIMDSDAAVATARGAIGKTYDPAQTTDPALRLEFDRDGTGPYWIYFVQAPAGETIWARVNALTAETKVKGP